MMRTILISMILLLNGAGVMAGQVLPDQETYTVMQQTLHDIHAGLKEVKPEFPQLSDIDTATIKINGLGDNGRIRFDYEKGVLKEDMSGPTFDKDGCDIVVQIKYPANQEDVEMRPQLKGTLVALEDGNAYAVWSLVRAEPNESGEAFKSRANAVIHFQLQLLQSKLKGTTEER